MNRSDWNSGKAKQSIAYRCSCETAAECECSSMTCYTLKDLKEKIYSQLASELTPDEYRRLVEGEWQ